MKMLLLFKIFTRLNWIRNVIVIKYINFRCVFVVSTVNGIVEYLRMYASLWWYDENTKVTKGNWWMAEQKKVFFFLGFIILSLWPYIQNEHAQRNSHIHWHTHAHNQMERTLHFAFMCTDKKLRILTNKREHPKSFRRPKVREKIQHIFVC